jgi:hypothetical protein
MQTVRRKRAWPGWEVSSMVVRKEVELFRDLIEKSRACRTTRLLVARLIHDAKVYHEVVLKPANSGIEDLSDASMYIEVDACSTFVERGRRILHANGISFPDMPLDLFCETLVTAVGA